MDGVQTTLNDARVDSELFQFARKNKTDMKFILHELDEYRRLKRQRRIKREVQEFGTL